MSDKPKRLSKFAAESAQQPAAASTMLALFQPAGVDESKFVRRNAPPMVKPGDVPVGQTITGTIVSVLDSPVSTVKGKLLWLRHESGTEYTFPCTGVIRNALCPGVKSEDGKELTAALEKFVGKGFAAKRLPDKQSSKFKKNMFMFDVFTTK